MVTTEVRVRKAREVFRGPGPQVNGLQAVPEGLWVSDQVNNRTYLVDFQGKVLTSFASPARNASGTSFGAGSVWAGNLAGDGTPFRPRLDRIGSTRDQNQRHTHRRLHS